MDRELTVQETRCVEVCRGNALQGYAVLSAGEWDAYVMERLGKLRSVGLGFLTKEEAVEAVKVRS